MKKVMRFIRRTFGNLMIRMANADIQDPDARGVVIQFIRERYLK